MKRILIDTDIGDDIDDALAIAYALNSEKLKVMGITTVFRDVEKRTQMVLQQLSAYGRLDIPVASGIGKPLINPADMEDVPAHWNPEAEAIPHNCDMHAVDFIIETIRKYPDTIITAIAPLTNIACAVRKAPDIMEHAHIWMMGGMYSEPYPEWNIQCDPEAAKIVLDSCEHVKMIGLDVTLQCRMDEDQIQKIRQSTDMHSRFIYEGLMRWMNKSGHLPILHDPLVLGAVEYPELLHFEKKYMQVECGGQYCRGVTAEKTEPFLRTPGRTNVEMATEVEVGLFIDKFLKTVFPETIF